jgi:large repetitive protein
MAKMSLFLALVLVIAAPAVTLAAGTLPLSQNSVSLEVGQNITVTANNPTGARIYVVSVSNAFVAHANVSGNQILVYALGSGSAQIGLCSYDNYCNTINVNVAGSGFGNQVVFSRNNFTLNVGETASVGISGSPYGYYIQSHSNNNAASAYISNNDLVVTGQNNGLNIITVCAQVSNVCSNLTVTVTGSNLYFTSSSPVPAYVGNYYSFQLGASGGTSPYAFSLASGSLPAGLNLSSGGFIYGTPVNNNEHYFTVRVTDYVGHTAISQGYYIRPNGSVQGALVYGNGTLVNDNGTIYITYKNTKSGFANMTAFTGHGYKLSNVVNGSTYGLSNTNYVVNTVNISHPWGSWIKSGNTVYFVHESGLIPIANYDVFINNGGADAKVVQMNAYDVGKTVLPIMTMNDSRLRP